MKHGQITSSGFMAISLLLLSGERVETGMLPFLYAPEVVVWHNQTFVFVELTGCYHQATFGVADDRPFTDCVMVRLETFDGNFVANAMLPLTIDGPLEVVRWGQRLFKLKEPRTYREAFFAIAHNLDTRLPEPF
ncbi:MAG TPA: hypothetical protein V6D07_18810 [Trichocoleus sp.]